MKTTFTTNSPEETIDLGIQLAGRLKPGSTVLLFGDLGAGKTHFAKGIAKGLGIDGIIKSPTFTYVNKYELNPNLHLYHYDLYRLNTGEEFHSIGLEESLKEDHAVNIVEWADRLDGIHPQEYIRVDLHSFVDYHEIDIHFVDSQVVPDELVEKYWNDWACPEHVRAHQKQVANVAVQVGKALNKRNILVDLNMVNTASLLHDMARIVDFNSLDESQFHEELTDEKMEKWKALRAQFNGMSHADVAAGALMEDNYNKTAELIRLHKSTAILDEPERFGILEVALVFYGDKRVKHDQVTDLDERFRDGRERNGHNDSPEVRELYDEVEKQTKDLEKQLFSLIDISPESLSTV